MKSILTLLVFFNLIAHANETDLTAFLIPPTSYKQTPETLEKAFPDNKSKRYFAWLNEEKTRAIFKRNRGGRSINLTILDGRIPIDEMILDFKDGRYEGSTVSIFNRGDGSKMSAAQFTERTTEISDTLSEILRKRPRERKANKTKGVLTNGLVWKSPRGMAALEYNVGAPKKLEFVRLRVGSYLNKNGIYVAAMDDRSQASIRKSEFKKNVIKEGSDVYIDNIPMVDQGSKGYCVVASIQRLFEYYGISCDMHQLAEIAGSKPDTGTSTIETNRQLGAIDYLFKTRYDCLAIKQGNGFNEIKDQKYVGKELSTDKIENEIVKSIDKGIPLLWSLTVGKYPEVPALHEQTSGGHMRLIIGYNLEERRLYFSDSWGAGHALKHMSLDDALKATSGFFLLTPTIN